MFIEIEKINVRRGFAKMKFGFQIPYKCRRLGDFTGLTRYGYPFGGPSPDELKPEIAEKVNSRWEDFYNTAYLKLLRFARNDEDLVHHGMLAVRGKLCQNPDAPISHLITCAKAEILTAVVTGIGSSVDTNGRRQHPYTQEDGRYNPKTGEWQDVFEYAVATSLDSVEKRAMLNLFYDSLTELEWTFVRFSLEERSVETKHGTCWRNWIGTEYIHSAEPPGKCTPSPKKRWVEETGLSEGAYHKAKWGAERKFRKIFDFSGKPMKPKGGGRAASCQV
jgi:hypothetical protein